MTRVAFLSVFAVFAGGAAAVAYLRRLILDLKQELLTMSDHLSQEIAELKSRVDAYKASQEAAQAALPEQIAAENAKNADLEAKLAAALATVVQVPGDTSAAEAALQAIIDSLPAPQTVPAPVEPAPADPAPVDPIPDATVTAA